MKMKIFIDTNILISAAILPDSVPARAVLKATSYPNIGITSEYNINEMIRIFYKKFSNRLSSLESFLSGTMFSLEIVPIPSYVEESEQNIRDIKDRPVLRAALQAGADFLLTGDKDFLESGVYPPKIINASDFLKL